MISKHLIAPSTVLPHTCAVLQGSSNEQQWTTLFCTECIASLGGSVAHMLKKVWEGPFSGVGAMERSESVKDAVDTPVFS